MDYEKSVQTSRIRPRTVGFLRINHSCEHVGRFTKSSKRCIEWSFGRVDQDGHVEEHLVELIWSLKSGKTRIRWNGRNITNLFPHCASARRVDLFWKLRTGETLEIVALAEAIPEQHQYDLLIDGTSIFRMPHLSERRATESTQDERRSPSNGGMEVYGFDDLSDIGSGEHAESPRPEALDFRLSMAGLTKTENAQVVDELRSDLYSPLLESLRSQIISCLPQTDEMVSHAIIKAFFADADSQPSRSDSSVSDTISFETDPTQIEVGALWEAYQWVALHKHDTDGTPRRDSEELALAYLQKQIESMFVRVRNEDIGSDEAASILLNVAAILGLHFVNSIAVDTVILDGIGQFTTVRDIEQVLESYGEIVACSIVKGHGFGCCHFRKERTAIAVQNASRQGLISIDGATPNIIAIAESLYFSEDRPCEYDEKTAHSVEFSRQIPQSRNDDIPHFMASLSDHYVCAYPSSNYEIEVGGQLYETPAFSGPHQNGAHSLSQNVVSPESPDKKTVQTGNCGPLGVHMDMVE